MLWDDTVSLKLSWLENPRLHNFPTTMLLFKLPSDRKSLVLSSITIHKILCAVLYFCFAADKQNLVAILPPTGLECVLLTPVTTSASVYITFYCVIPVRADELLTCKYIFPVAKVPSGDKGWPCLGLSFPSLQHTCTVRWLRPHYDQSVYDRSSLRAALGHSLLSGWVPGGRGGWG